jgi:hypothetical protein
MAIGAQHLKVIGAVVERVSINMINVERATICYWVLLVPATFRAFIPSLFEQVLSDVPSQPTVSFSPGRRIFQPFLDIFFFPMLCGALRAAVLASRFVRFPAAV